MEIKSIAEELTPRLQHLSMMESSLPKVRSDNECVDTKTQQSLSDYDNSRLHVATYENEMKN